MTDILQWVTKLVKAGLSVIPIRTDGSKAPTIGSWKPFQKAIAECRVLKEWFSHRVGIAVIAGKVSGNLEVLDFDDFGAFGQWRELILELYPQELAAKLRLWVETPGGGLHCYYRCVDGVEPGQKLAQREITDPAGRPQIQTLIETRGEGNYVILPGSPPDCHPLDRRYEFVIGEDFDDIPILHADEREALLNIARSLNEFIAPERVINPVFPVEAGDRPGDDFNERGDWKEILKPHGWKKVSKKVQVGYWRRPGKEVGISATTNYARSNLLYVFSTNANPFEARRAYNKFAAYTLLNHEGDFSAAARELFKLGFGNDKSQAAGGSINFARDPVKPFPIDVLPGPLRKFASEAAEAICCPVDFLGVPTLTILGTAIGTSRVLVVKEGWQEGPRIWVVIVGDPGTKKSPALNKAMAPFYELQAELNRDWAIASEAGEPPLGWSQVYTTDATMEALGDVLQANPRGIVYATDELRGWVLGMNQYKAKGADRANWLSLWNGSPIHVNRRNRKVPLYVVNPFVGVCGGIQPEVLDDLCDERARTDGFIHRLLFTFPNPIPNKWSNAEIDSATMEDYLKVIQALRDLEADQDGAPVAVKFNDSAKAIWIDWVEGHYREMDGPELPAGLRGPWAKLEGYCVRFALILQETRFVCGEVISEDVDDVSLYGAIKLLDYFKSHVKSVYPRFHTTAEDRRIQQAVDWVHMRGGSATAREVYTAKVTNCRTLDKALALFREIERRGLGRVEEIRPAHGGKPTFKLHLDGGRHSAP